MAIRVAIAGAGVRALSFANGILQDHVGEVELVGLFDTNPQRMAGFCELIGRKVNLYTSMAELARRERPDMLIVCTPDHTHPEIIEQAMALGMDAICEKPLAISREGLERIRGAERKYNRRVRVTFNLRYSPFSAKVRELLQKQVIGRVLSVSAEWFVDRTHGVEYFRRWHAHLAASGGLLVHKATHHFDLINWWLDAAPAQVCATGSLEVFGKANAFRGQRCRGCPHIEGCWAAMRSQYTEDVNFNPNSEATIFQKLYFDAEKVDGYLRDRCVFDESIDIYDTMSVLVKYDNGAMMSYGLMAYAPYQGYEVAFTGTEGRLEVRQISAGTRPEGESANSIKIIRGMTRKDIRMEKVELPVETRSHDGGDYRMLRHLFGQDADPLGQAAGTDAGARSALVGISANESIRDKGWVEVKWEGMGRG